MDTIEELLTRGVEKIYPSREALEKVLRSGKKLRLYQGFDPTGAQLHIGHAVALRKLRQFQDLGHHVIFLIGDFTGLIGDPTDKTATRRKMTREEVLTNTKDYQKQAGKILRFEGENPVEIKFNSEWLAKLTFAEVIELASRFTVQQVIERDMFQERLKRQNDIGLHEFLYPLMQGYDSVAMEVDLELGGTDQTFNMLAGRKLVAQLLHKEKFVMTVPLLTDARGVKIGKTEGNVIGLTDPPKEFFGKIMALGDEAIIPCFTLLTDIPLEEIDAIKKKMEAGENPMAFKKQLAFELTKQFNSESAAKDAQEEFERVHQEGNLSEVTAKEFQTAVKEWDPIELLVKTKLASSRSNAKRLIESNAVKMIEDDVVGIIIITPGNKRIGVRDGTLIRVGKNKFVKIRLKT